MTRLRSYARMAAQSQKVKDGADAFAAVYAEVDARSEGRCEVSVRLEGGKPNPRPLFIITTGRCPKRAVDHHHVVKPRRNHHDVAHVVHLCREHHERCEWPYKRGRLVALPVLGQPGRFTFLIQYAADKFRARGQGA